MHQEMEPATSVKTRFEAKKQAIADINASMSKTYIVSVQLDEPETAEEETQTAKEPK